MFIIYEKREYVLDGLIDDQTRKQFCLTTESRRRLPSDTPLQKDQ